MTARPWPRGVDTKKKKQPPVRATSSLCLADRLWQQAGRKEAGKGYVVIVSSCLSKLHVQVQVWARVDFLGAPSKQLFGCSLTSFAVFSIT